MCRFLSQKTILIKRHWAPLYGWLMYCQCQCHVPPNNAPRLLLSSLWYPNQKLLPCMCDCSSAQLHCPRTREGKILSLRLSASPEAHTWGDDKSQVLMVRYRLNRTQILRVSDAAQAHTPLQTHCETVWRNQHAEAVTSQFERLPTHASPARPRTF